MIRRWLFERSTSSSKWAEVASAGVEIMDLPGRWWDKLRHGRVAPQSFSASVVEQVRKLGPEVMGQLAPPIFHDDGAYHVEPPEPPKWIILHFGTLTPEVEVGMAEVLCMLRWDNISLYHANVLLCHEAYGKFRAEPLLLQATTYQDCPEVLLSA